MQSFYCTIVYVTGPKEVIGRILAAVKRNVGDSIPVEINLTDPLDEEDYLLDKDKTTAIIGCDNSVVPESVKEMTPDAFSGCSCEPLMKERFPVESPDDWINGLFY
jgi:hypothetical protein